MTEECPEQGQSTQSNGPQHMLSSEVSDCHFSGNADLAKRTVFPKPPHNEPSSGMVKLPNIKHSVYNRPQLQLSAYKNKINWLSQFLWVEYSQLV